MKTQTIISNERWEDIVFENRNKEYGAYQIRRIYSKRVVVASTITVLVLAFVFAYPSILEYIRSHQEEEVVAPKLTTVSLDQPPPITPNQPPPPKLDVPPPVKTIKYVAPKVTKEEVPDEEVPTQEELKQTVISNETVEGEETVVFEEPVKQVVVEEEEDKIFTVVEQPAEFPGGMEALAKFLNKNIRYPSSARRMGVDGKVYVQFVVDKEGKISDVQILKSLSADCDKEALRLLGIMPSWKPGRQNGRSVKSKFVLPFFFKLEI